jgi:hypothetical protein
LFRSRDAKIAATPGVGVRERLPRAVDVEESQGGRRNLELPVPRRQLLVRPRLGSDVDTFDGASVQPFAVDRHRRRNDNLREVVADRGRLLEDNGGTHRVDRRVLPTPTVAAR